MKSAVCTTVLTLAALLVTSAAHATVVTANNSAGDSYSNPFAFNRGQAVSDSGWYYNNVRNNANIGIDGDYARSGNGSVSFSSPSNGKADIEYLANASANFLGNYSANGFVGALADLTSFSYDWYRDPNSAAAAGLHPSLRVLFDRDGNLATTNDRGGLVFERAYNGVATPAGEWVTDTVSATTKLWNFGLGGTLDINNNGYAYDSNLTAWQAFMPNARIMGFSSGVGSGWNTFSGAVDNVSWTIAGVTTSTNFEKTASQVPEPASLSLLAIGLLGLAARRKKQA